MPYQRINAYTIEEAVRQIIPCLEDRSTTAHSAIYFDGWRGLAASAALRAIAEEPPPSLLKIFNKIIHIDCSRWTSRRALQRAIAVELRLPQQVIAIIDRQDKEDDFRGVHEGSRAEIPDVVLEIYQALQGHRCLLIFHNGSHNTVDFNDFGITPSWLSGNKVLWTFRGRLRLQTEINKKEDDSHLYIFVDEYYRRHEWKYLIQEEATEIACCTDKLDLTPEIVEECCLYLLSLNYIGGDIIDYSWATHAANYWICDGIIQGGHESEAWDLGTALQQQIRLEDYASNTLPTFGDELETPSKRWICVTNEKTRWQDAMTVPPESTSFFLAGQSGSDPPLASLPDDMFHLSGKLRVLKLCHCTFKFSLPPFRCCRSLRFLGLDSCEDKPQEEVEKKDSPATDFFQSLWVLHLCNTDWKLDLSPETMEKMAANLREVNIKKGRIWSSSLPWRQLHNLQKLRVIEPTYPWDTRKMDELADMMKLELLELSRDSTIQVLPSLSGAIGLKTLVLDGCIRLEHIGPEALPPSLVSFSLCASKTEEDRISRICLAGCASLVKFRLCGSLSNLVDLDLSGTKVIILDLNDKVVQVPSLQRIILLGCLHLQVIVLPEEPLLRKLSVFRVDSNSSGETVGPHLKDSLITDRLCAYADVNIGKVNTDHRNSIAPHFQPLGRHVEIGEGISYGNVASVDAVHNLMNTVESLHVHDNSFISSVIPERILNFERRSIIWYSLKLCRAERCPKMLTVFGDKYYDHCFEELENFWAVDLPMAHCIWIEGISPGQPDSESFANLRGIYLYSCPRLTFVLTFSWAAPGSYLPNLETLHIVYCGDLRHVFPVDKYFLEEIAADHRKGIMEFPNLKHIYLHELPKLHQICETKMSAPKLETVKLRGCWSLRRLPAVGILHRYSKPTVDCEKDWWEKLEWDGLEAGHHHSLFETRHSLYYKKSLPRTSVLR